MKNIKYSNTFLINLLIVLIVPFLSYPISFYIGKYWFFFLFNFSLTYFCFPFSAMLSNSCFPGSCRSMRNVGDIARDAFPFSFLSRRGHFFIYLASERRSLSGKDFEKKRDCRVGRFSAASSREWPGAGAAIASDSIGTHFRGFFRSMRVAMCSVPIRLMVRLETHAIQHIFDVSCWADSSRNQIIFIRRG